ncbi:zeta toxin family protein [Streptomyces sp. R28]|uniref:UDP-N-acetylglucosamine kinase n=1 Tax=Streptomyces sp. R28 TaxID=3238628 RepID=A0AB39Q8K4_9ACTN
MKRRGQRVGRDWHIAPVVLNEDRHAEILRTDVLPTWTRDTVAQENPVAVFVAGQPGSGKSRLADLLQASLNRRGGAVRVDGDRYKALHPSYAVLLAEDERTAGLKVRPDVRRWQAEVEEYVRAHRLDAVIEAALTDPEEFRIASRAFRTAGHRIDVTVLAAPGALSQLGVLDRYIRQVHAARTGRFVSWEDHDACVNGLLATLRVIEDERLADRVTVFRRDGEVLYRNELTAGAWRRPSAAAPVVTAEHVRPWSAEQTWRLGRELFGTEERLADLRVSADQRLAVRGCVERVIALSEPVRRIAQPLSRPPGVDYHRLSAGEHRRILRELIVPALGEITAHDAPLAVYVMAQPGAGKSRPARLVRQALRLRRPTAVVGDDFKAAHPDYLRLLEVDPRTAGARIRADYQAWQEEAEAYVRARRGDVVVEIAPGSAGQLLAGAARYHEAGYRVELVALGVRAADSRQGTAVRYAEMRRKNLPARFTTASGHDVCFAAVADAVRAAEHSRTVDSVAVMRRDGSAAHRTERDADQPWIHLAGAVPALVGEQQRPYGEEEAARFLTVQRRLRAALPQYRAEIAQITRLAWPLMPGHLRPPRLTGPGAPSALPARYEGAPGPTSEAGAAG